MAGDDGDGDYDYDDGSRPTTLETAPSTSSTRGATATSGGDSEPTVTTTTTATATVAATTAVSAAAGTTPAAAAGEPGEEEDEANEVTNERGRRRRRNVDAEEDEGYGFSETTFVAEAAVSAPMAAATAAASPSTATTATGPPPVPAQPQLPTRLQRNTDNAAAGARTGWALSVSAASAVGLKDVFAFQARHSTHTTLALCLSLDHNHDSGGGGRTTTRALKSMAGLRNKGYGGSGPIRFAPVASPSDVTSESENGGENGGVVNGCGDASRDEALDVTAAVSAAASAVSAALSWLAAESTEPQTQRATMEEVLGLARWRATGAVAWAGRGVQWANPSRPRGREKEGVLRVGDGDGGDATTKATKTSAATALVAETTPAQPFEPVSSSSDTAEAEPLPSKVVAEAAFPSSSSSAAAGAAVLLCEARPVDTSRLRSPLRLHTLTPTSADLVTAFGHDHDHEEGSGGGGAFQRFVDHLRHMPFEVDEQLVDMVNDAVSSSPGGGAGGGATAPSSPSSPASFSASTAVTPDTFVLPGSRNGGSSGGGSSGGRTGGLRGRGRGCGGGSSGGSGSKGPSSSASSSASSSSSSSSSSLFLAYPALRGVSRDELELRLVCARKLNDVVNKALPLVDLRESSTAGTLAHSVVHVASPLLWLSTKLKLWDRALAASAAPDNGSGGRFEFPLNRHLASAQLGKKPGKSTDLPLLHSSFGQVFAAVDGRPPSALRVSGKDARAWKVVLVGEGAIDAGGPYRESLSDCVGDLFKPHTNLFVPCANRKAETEGFVSGMAGIHHMDKFVPNPSKTSTPLHLRLFGFVGKLLGLAMRSGAALPFHFPPLLYKRVLGHGVGKADLKRIDKFLVDYLEQLLKAPHDQHMSEELFEDLYGGRAFTTKSVAGRQVELCEQGKRKALTLANSGHFVELMYQYHLHEFDAAASAIASGLATVVPLAVLRLFTASQFELLVTGRAEVDLGLLRRQTVYEAPYSDNHPTILLFWAMMEGFSHAERSMMIKFAWSRDRLPLRAEDFSAQFKITRLSVSSSDPNHSFPQAHTCFFTIDLPEYSTLEAMSLKVRYAIENCTAIDTDNHAGDFQVDDQAGGGGGGGVNDDSDSDEEEEEDE